jgi:hypothetical protein
MLRQADNELKVILVLRLIDWFAPLLHVSVWILCALLLSC